MKMAGRQMQASAAANMQPPMSATAGEAEYARLPARSEPSSEPSGNFNGSAGFAV